MSSPVTPGDLVALALGAAVLCALLLALLVPVLRRHALDVPGHRSSHTVPTPRGGGLAVLGALLTGFVVVAALGGDLPAAMVVAVLLFGLLGVAEDLRGVPVLLRLSVQAGAAAAVALAVPGLSYALVPVAVVAVVGYANVFNFMDGVNGISGAAVAVAGLYWMLLAGPNTTTAVVALLLGSALGFLPWNAPRAKVFLGDSGSYAYGAALATVAVLLLEQGLSPFAVVAPLLPYLADTSTTMLRRALRGENVLTAHRLHAYQRLTDVGLGHPGATGAVVAATVACCVLGGAHQALTDRMSPLGVALPLLAALVCAGYLTSPAWLRRLRPARVG